MVPFLFFIIKQILCNNENSITGLTGDAVGLLDFVLIIECELNFYAPCRQHSVSPGSDITDNSYTFSPTDLLRFYVDDQIIEGELFMT